MIKVAKQTDLLNNILSGGSVSGMSTVHSRIKHAMRVRGLTMETLEQQMGRSRGYVSRFLSEGRSPRIESVQEFARHLRVTLDWLVNCEGPMEPGASTRGETYALLDGWAEAAAEVLRNPRWKGLGYAVRAVGERPVLVRPEHVTPEFVAAVARFWLEYAPEIERAEAEQVDASRCGA